MLGLFPVGGGAVAGWLPACYAQTGDTHDVGSQEGVYEFWRKQQERYKRKRADAAPELADVVEALEEAKSEGAAIPKRADRALEQHRIGRVVDLASLYQNAKALEALMNAYELLLIEREEEELLLLQ